MLDGAQEGRVDNFAYFISEINGADKEETGTVVVLQLGEGRIATSLLPRFRFSLVSTAGNDICSELA